MDKYLSVITNFGCHGRCPYCIVRENEIKVPKSTVDGLDKLEDVDRALLQEGLNKANSYINKIEELFDPYGGIN